MIEQSATCENADPISCDHCEKTIAGLPYHLEPCETGWVPLDLCWSCALRYVGECIHVRLFPDLAMTPIIDKLVEVNKTKMAQRQSAATAETIISFCAAPL